SSARWEPGGRAALGASRRRRARILSYLGKTEEALAASRLARADQEALVTAPGASNDAQRDLAEAIHELGIQLMFTDKQAEAAAEFRAAMTIQQKLVAENPTVPEFRRGLGNSHGHLGMVLLRL